MEKGDWDSAATSFAFALKRGNRDPQSMPQKAQVPEAVECQVPVVWTICVVADAWSRAFFAFLQYLAAVMLLKEASRTSKVMGARLSRYAAALTGLTDKHHLALVHSSATRNMEKGVENFGCVQRSRV